MAAKYDWGDGLGKVHSISLVQHKANVAAVKGKGKGSAPTGAPIVPAGTYDPNLDAQTYQGARTLKDAVGLAPDTATGTYGGDIGKALERNSTDFTTGTTNLTEDYNTGTARTEQLSGRSLSALLTARTRGDEDYKTNMATLARNYQNLGDAQNAGVRKAGAAGGGAFEQAAAKRATNQALEAAPITTAYNRATDDSKTAETQIGEDKTYDLGNLKTNYTRGITTLGTTYKRTGEDQATLGERAVRDYGALGQDIQAAKVAQFQQMYPGAALPTAAVPLTAAQKAAKGMADKAHQDALKAHANAIAAAKRRVKAAA